MSLLGHHDHQNPAPDARIVSTLSFLAGIVSILVIQGTMQQFKAETSYAESNQTTFKTTKQVYCQTNLDCLDPVEVCDATTNTCTPLPPPHVGQCTQPQVLTYRTRGTQNVKHTFCKNKCAITSQGAQCI